MPRSKKYDRVMVYMRRALRVEDNIPLWAAREDAKEVLPVICLQPDAKYDNDTPRRRFVSASLTDLDAALRKIGSRLIVLRGNPVEELAKAAHQWNVDAVHAARVYDPATLTKDETLRASLSRQGKALTTFKDRVLFEGDEIRSGKGLPYKVFTPYYNAWLEKFDQIPLPVGRPRSLNTPAIGESLDRHLSVTDAEGGETQARRRLRHFITKGIRDYKKMRDYPAVDGTSRLSHHLALGTISIRKVLREVHEAKHGASQSVRRNINAFIRELVWREFFYQALANFPHAAKGPFREQAGSIPWNTDRKVFETWCQGKTGYPIIDAGMRHLEQEGWMHNRVRMIVASFLTKDLHINWQWGERYFMEHLIDADIANNNGGWQWVAGTGTDASPWFRVFNPITQGKKFDPQGDFVRRYVPELRGIKGAKVHEPWAIREKDQLRSGIVIGKDYPFPMVDHAEARLKVLELYKKHYK